MSEKITNYTAAGFKALQDELDYLKNVKMEEVKADIAQARSYGDLSENSEYDEAKNEQAKVAARMMELENMIAHAVVVDDGEIDESVVSIGSLVTVLNEKLGKEITYHIVGSYEADAFNKKISDISPIGAALLGNRAGDTVTATVPAGEISIKILDVKRAN